MSREIILSNFAMKSFKNFKKAIDISKNWNYNKLNIFIFL